ncbi:MAG: GNAT family N-acetyltransferase [Anaerolineales bacterium]|jgi:mycothiol synthase
MNPQPLIPLPLNLTPFEWRAIQPSDLPGIQAMLAASREADQVDKATSEERLAQILGMLGEQLDQHSRIALSPDGRVAAAAMLLPLPGSQPPLAMIEGNVHVDFRGLGIGSYLLAWMEARARQAFAAAGITSPVTLRGSCRVQQINRATFFTDHGFEVVRYAYQMRRTLEIPIPEAALPEGLRWETWSPELDPRVMTAFNLAFQGHFGLPEMDPEAWSKFFTGVPQFRGDLSLVALDGVAIAGFCINWVADREGWIEAIGVLPSWRGQGVASALMARSLRQFRSAGLNYAGLDVDTQNPTGALRLYKKFGFAVRKEIHVYHKHLGQG